MIKSVLIQMRVIKLTSKNHQEVISQTIKVLHSGGLVVFPSDTVYGLLADSCQPSAISRLLAFKDRTAGKAIAVFVADEKMASKYVEINQNAQNVINNLLPGPFTVVCAAQPRKALPCEAIDPRLLAENGTLGFRIPNYPLITALVSAYDLPLTATSANLSGRPPVHSISALFKTLSGKKKGLLDLVVDAGTLAKNRPSTVIDTTTGQLKTLRIGEFLPKTAKSLISGSEEETKHLARFLLTKFVKKNFSKPIVFLLEGNLGAGKTIFAKGLGEALGIKGIVTSPTFNICNEYKINIASSADKTVSSQGLHTTPFDTNLHCHKSSNNIISFEKFIHFDLFRLDSEKELKEIKFLESFRCGNIYAVEWPERLSAEIISALKNLAEIVYIKIKTVDKTKRSPFARATEGLRKIEWGD